MQDNEIKVGTVLYRAFRDSRAGRNSEVTVESVGTKYLTFKERNVAKIDKIMLRDSYSVFWPSKEAYDDHCERDQAWQNLRRFVMDRHFPLPGVHVQTIRMAHELLQTVTRTEPDGS